MTLPSVGSKSRYNPRRQTYNSKSSSVYKPTRSGFLRSFYAVLQRWQSETMFTSSPIKKTSHPSYRALVDNARLVTPLIIEELRKNPSPLVWVLEEAYKIHPYSDSDIGDIEATSKAWVIWAENNGQTLQP